MSKGLGGHLQISAPLDTKAFFFFFFSQMLVPKAGEGEDIYAPLIFSEEPGATHPPKNSPDGKRN